MRQDRPSVDIRLDWGEVVDFAKPDITLRVYAHLFRNDDDGNAAAINAALAR
ncbi:hypothetical protein ACVI1L_000674 [Bradyrhizobium sp. USDA 4516]